MSAEVIDLDAARRKRLMASIREAEQRGDLDTAIGLLGELARLRLEQSERLLRKAGGGR